MSEPVSLGPTATVGDTECVAISLRDDEEVEVEQSFSVLLDADSNITSPGNITGATVTIADNDSKSVTCSCRPYAVVGTLCDSLGVLWANQDSLSLKQQILMIKPQNLQEVPTTHYCYV